MFAQNDVHQQFAEYFAVPELKPYAYLLSRKLSEGHICLDLNQPYEEQENLPAYCLDMPTGDKPLRSMRLVARGGKDDQPFVLDGNRLYIQRYFRYETSVLRSILNFIQAEEKLLGARTALLNTHASVIGELLKMGGGTVDWQTAAAITGVLHNFTIITGGPGTGKTTTVARILAILYTMNISLKVALAAPTGKAAARLAESLRNTSVPLSDEIKAKFGTLAPSTIHRLLRPKMGTPYFRYGRDNPLPFDVVIVDECSMIDIALFAKLLEAIGPETRIILLGDKDQLASVEAGSIFGDICQAQKALNFFSARRAEILNRYISAAAGRIHGEGEGQIPDQGEEQIHGDAGRKIPDDAGRQIHGAEGRVIPADNIDDKNNHPLFQHVVELRYSHRFASGNDIGRFSKGLLSGELLDLKDPEGQVIIDPTYSDALFERFISGYSAFIEEKENIHAALGKLNGLRVLCAVREGEHGLYAVNRNIERYLHDRKLIDANTEFYENRPIMLSRNYYEHGLFNGDIGIIRPDDKGTLMAWFEDSSGVLKAVLPSYLTQSETVYAMTIHKSQGSEFNEVLVILPSVDTRILTRELLYTAVTRAKQRVYIQGAMEVLSATAERFVERASGIASRFENL